jgi:hypothetical protein
MGNLPNLSVAEPVPMSDLVGRREEWIWGYPSSAPSEEPSMPERWRSRMNPCWAEQYMGYPAGWTDVGGTTG